MVKEIIDLVNEKPNDEQEESLSTRKYKKLLGIVVEGAIDACCVVGVIGFTCLIAGVFVNRNK